MTAGVRDYEITLQPYSHPAIVEGFSLQLHATTPMGRVIQSGGLHDHDGHQIGLVMVDLPSGVISANLVWMHPGFRSQHRLMLNPATPTGSIMQVMQDSPGTPWTWRGKKRHGVSYYLTIGRPVILGQGADAVPKLREAARLAEAKRQDVLNGLYSLWRAHGGRAGN